MSIITGCFNLPTDDYRDNLTLEEAQDLVSISICIPDYIPPGIDTVPNIVYVSDWANVPEEKYIRLQYKKFDSQVKAIEVFQRFTNDKGLKFQSPDTLSKTILNKSKVNLLDWISSDIEINKTLDRIHIEADVIQTRQTVWRFFEIVDPENFRSTKTNWVKDHVEYRILSLLPAEEIKKVTQSMMDCSNP